jgi:pyridoxamine 5'-phosphate oxidase
VALTAPDDPLARFRDLLGRALSIEEGDPRAMALATADAAGRPSVRVVIGEGLEGGDFVFFTSYESRKARDLQANPWAALCFHWLSLSVQVRIEGAVEKLPPPNSDESFASRSRAHQIAAWTSRQCAPLASRRELLERYREAEARHAGEAIPRPPHWGGYRLRPERIEFWHGFENRLHDRIVYIRGDEGWIKQRIEP